MTNPDQRLQNWVQEHGSAVRGYLAAMLHRSGADRGQSRALELDDLWQEVFRRAWQARDRYQELGNARAYLLRIADHLICDYQRQAHREVQLDAKGWEQAEPVEKGEEPMANLIRKETQQQLSAALDRLSEPQRRVLLLRYFGNLSFAEIAETVQWPLNTVLSHSHRGLLALRKQFVESPT